MENVRVKEVQMNEIDWDKVYEYFQGYSHIDIHNIPENYEDYIIPMLELLKNEAVIQVKYGITKVIARNTTEIILENHFSFTGKMIARAYADAEKIIIYVMTIRNIDQLLQNHPDLMESFFLEYWATSILNSLREQYYEVFETSLVDEGYKLTCVWSPGQTQFELSNQETLFQLLKPEEIGVILDRYNRMIPLKSVSGTVGIAPKESTIELNSCDFCPHAKTCPGYKGKKYVDISMEQRRI